MDGVLVFGFDTFWCLDNQLSIIGEMRLGESPTEAASCWNRILNGKIDGAFAQFLKELEKKVNRFFVESQKMAEEFSRLYEVKVVHFEDVELWRRIREKFLKQHLKDETFTGLRETTLLISRQAIRESSEQKDQLIVQAIGALDEVEKTLNLIASRLREWYGLHFPETTQRMEKARDLARLVAEGGHRNKIQEKPELLELLPKQATKSLVSGQSMGAEISEFDMNMIQALAEQFLKLYQFREELENYIDDAMYEIAPNLRGLIGPLLGARLIELAGSIEKLARLPASTIQVLGAEQALFRALKTGARPPKHGVIFQHTFVHSAPWWQRGKIARILAGKIAIAARVDMYSGEFIADDLKASVTSRIAEVKRKYPSGPKVAPRPKPASRQFHQKTRKTRKSQPRSKPEKGTRSKRRKHKR